mgnify:CR=1 FL=1
MYLLRHKTNSLLTVPTQILSSTAGPTAPDCPPLRPVSYLLGTTCTCTALAQEHRSSCARRLDVLRSPSYLLASLPRPLGGHDLPSSSPHRHPASVHTQCSTANVVYYINVVLLADEVHVSAPCPCLPETTRIPLKSRVHWSTRKNLPHYTAQRSPIVLLVRFEISSSYAYHPRQNVGNANGSHRITGVFITLWESSIWAELKSSDCE